MTTEIIIRAATVADLPSVISLWAEHQEYHVRCDPFFKRAEDADHGFLKYLQENLDKHGLFVAQFGNRIIGFALLEISKRPPCFAIREYGTIDDLAVTSEFRGKGIGQRLLAQALKWFTDKGITRIETRVLNSNPLSTVFWRKAGFESYMSCVYKK